jgi:hypothetical protein
MEDVERIISVLESQAGAADAMLEAMRAMLGRIVGLEAEQAELRDELLALSNRIEAVTRLSNSKP